MLLLSTSVLKMSAVHVILILTIVNFSVSESFNDSSSDEIEVTSCPFDLRTKFEDRSNVFQFVMHGILLPIVALFGLVCSIISIFIFTQREMRRPINLIFTGKKHFDSLSILILEIYLIVMPDLKRIISLTFRSCRN